MKIYQKIAKIGSLQFTNLETTVTQAQLPLSRDLAYRREDRDSKVMKRCECKREQVRMSRT